MHLVDVRDPRAPKHAAHYNRVNREPWLRVSVDEQFMPQGPVSEGWVVMRPASEPRQRKVPGELLLCCGYQTPVALDGDVLFAGREILDVADPATPIFLSVLPDAANSMYSLVLRDGLAFTVGYYGWLQVFDVRDPMAPIPVSVLATGGASDMVIVGNYAYLATHPVRIADISDPINPRLRGKWSLGDVPMDVDVEGSLAYYTLGDVVRILDVSDPDHLFYVGSIFDQGAAGIDVIGTLAYLVNGHELKIYDVSDPRQPHLLSNLDVSGSALNVEIAGTRAYVADSGAGVQVLEVTTPANPIQIARYDGVWVTDLAVRTNLVLFADISDQLKTIDLTQGSNAIPTTVPATLSVRTVAINGPRAVGGGGPFHYFDISQPTNPVIIGTISNLGWHDVALGAGLAYGANGLTLRVVSLENPSFTPRIIGSYTSSMGSEDIRGGLDVHGSTVWFTAFRGFEAVDVSVPSQPRPLRAYRTRGIATSIQVVGRYAYVTSVQHPDSQVVLEGFGLEVHDLDAPEPPTLVGSYPISMGAWGVRVVGNLVYVAAGEEGLLILEQFEVPRISARSLEGDVVLSWPAKFTQYRLEQSEDLETWMAAPSGRQNPVTVPTTHRSSLFYRLSKP
jgi:hypothetical protein